MGSPTIEERAAGAAELLRHAGAAAKCRPCGCARHSVEAIAALAPSDDRLVAAVHDLRSTLVEQRYGCLGCAVCWPAEALALLDTEVEAGHPGVCPTQVVAERRRWPPLPGAYTVLRWRAPVAVCTLSDAELAGAVARQVGPETAIVGTLATENHGIERLIRNVVANPNVRFLVLAGPETRGAVDHLPGASLLALVAAGVDSHSRIIGAPGRRPVLRNLTGEEIAAFRSQVEVVDLIGEADPATIAGAAHGLGRRDPGPVVASTTAPAVPRLAGYVPARMTPDPAGYFVISVDRVRGGLTLEHYANDGALDLLIEGASAAECSTPAIDAGLVARLDHAAYLGRELARAEAALAGGTPFVQDAAPERAGAGGCGCGTGCDPA